MSWAKWVLYTNSDDGTELYYEDTSLRKTGSTVKMWTMFSGLEGTLEEKEHHSFTELSVYDCKKEVKKFLSLTFYEGQMGKGKVTVSYTYKDDEWKPFVPGSLYEVAWKIACGKI
jgi:hypothetical protein